ncbi:DUF423 domain-containing protein [Lewinella sp. W8]|uniref:DUF423 domain-containing protein n=1 Tax=Lewinella sp. W8 TaxID=2528208 RepID=UPI00106770E7|nr:DUF423 domain-containing protein [Lewinella sp. W8]MTB50849.1 DUF423 domain-containing protein [Lewinella sp. W8]
MEKIVKLAALLGALAVALGAFGAHGLKNLVGPDQIETFQIGVRYHFLHTLAILLVGVLWDKPTLGKTMLNRSVWCFGLGMLLFSGSLYLLSLREVHGLPVGFLGPVTPIGGLLLIAGWVMLFFAPARRAQ